MRKLLVIFVLVALAGAALWWSSQRAQRRVGDLALAPRPAGESALDRAWSGSTDEGPDAVAPPREPEAPARPGDPLLVELIEPPAQRYGEHPWTEADRKYASVLQGLPGVAYDPALGHAARELAGFYALHRTMAPSGALQFILNAAGAAEWDVLRSMVVTGDTSDAPIRARVEELLAQAGAGVRVGLGESYPVATPPRRYIAIVLSRTRLSLEPVARSVPTGQIVSISGELPRGVTAPSALVMAPDLTLREASVEASGRRFRLEVAAGEEPGALQIELIGVRETGPHPLAQLDLHVGRRVPKSWEGDWPPDEEDIQSAAAAETLAFELLDADRRRFGLPELVRDAALDAVARGHSRDMRDHGFVGHVSPRTGSVHDRLGRAGYDALMQAENLARNRSLWDAERGLFHSLGHRQNILSPLATHVGLGVALAEADGRRSFYVTQVFARPAPVIDPAHAGRAVSARLAAARQRAGLASLRRDEALDAVARAEALVGDPTPRGVLAAAAARGLTRRGAAVSVARIGELDDFSVPELAADPAYRRLGVGVHQTAGRPGEPPRIVVVVIAGG